MSEKTENFIVGIIQIIIVMIFIKIIFKLISEAYRLFFKK
jgi:hypothetical protein